MDVNNISTLSGARTYLKSLSSNKQILDEIRNIIYSWNYKSEYNIDAIKNDLEGIIAEVIFQLFNDKNNDDIFKAVTCIVYNEIYENLIPLIRGNFSKEDLFFYEKCQHFCKLNVTPGEFGSSIYNSLQFTAAIFNFNSTQLIRHLIGWLCHCVRSSQNIVELSVLDTYKSPIEKINCLCYTYDLIYADLKLALASIISKYSEKELEIPIINNEEVIPILTLVVIKSKLLYLPSNLFYIQFFGENIIQQSSGLSSILRIFETVIHNLMKSEENSIELVPDKPSHMDIRETMEIMADTENLENNENDTAKLVDEEKKRLVALITTSTTEKNFIPFDLPKIFS